MNTMNQAIQDRNELRMQKLTSGSTLSFASLITAQLLCRFGQVSEEAAQNFQKRADRAFDPTSGGDAAANWGEINIKGLMAQQLLALEQVGRRVQAGSEMEALISGPGLRAETAMQMLERAGRLHPEMAEHSNEWLQEVQKDVVLSRETAEAINRGLACFKNRRSEAFKENFAALGNAERMEIYQSAYQEAANVMTQDNVVKDGVAEELSKFENKTLGAAHAKESAKAAEQKKAEAARVRVGGFQGLMSRLGIGPKTDKLQHETSAPGKERQINR